MWNPEICQDPPACAQDDLVFFNAVDRSSKGDMGKQAHALISLRFFQFSTDFNEKYILIMAE